MSAVPTIGLISSGQPYIALKDWFRNAQQYARKHEELSEVSLKVRHESNAMRDAAAIDTSLSQRATNELLLERLVTMFNSFRF